MHEGRPEPTWAMLREAWAATRDRPVQTIADMDEVLRRFEVHTGTKRPAVIRTEDCRDFRDALLQGGVDGLGKLAPKTVLKKLALLRALLAVGVERGWLASNPAADITVKGAPKATSEREPFTQADLKRIFTSPIFKRGERPAGGAGDAAYWLPVLALYTGARLEELGQLECTDLAKTDGMPYLDITRTSHDGDADEDEDDAPDEAGSVPHDRQNGESNRKRLKTASSKRRIPLHPRLIELGFIQYVDKLRATGETRVFPDLQRDTKGKLTGNWSKWWSRYLRQTIGIRGKDKVFHSFRHSFEQGCLDCGVDTEIRHALTGHRIKTTSDAYGTKNHLRFPLSRLFAEIKKLQFDVDIPANGC